MAFVRSLVSKKKKRYTNGGYNLDLTYITPNIIAMGFPSAQLEATYRNPVSEVVRFLEEKHREHYRVYNLCSERSYAPSVFKNQCESHPFDDHNTPTFEMLIRFAKSVHTYIQDDERNTAVIHCKAGKGRTGLMIAAYLLHSGQYSTAESALKFYGITRTSNGKGVTIPSQIRWVHYYEAYLQSQESYIPRTVMLHKIIMRTIPRFNKEGTCNPSFLISKNKDKLYSSKSSTQPPFIKGQCNYVFDIEPPLPLSGDIKIEFHHKDFLKKEKMFHFWFNPFFHPGVVSLSKDEIDGAHKDKKNRIFDSGFGVELYFYDMSDSDTKGVQSGGLIPVHGAIGSNWTISTILTEASTVSSCSLDSCSDSSRSQTPNEMPKKMSISDNRTLSPLRENSSGDLVFPSEPMLAS